MVPLSASAPAGWYPDSDPRLLRYWDGTAWTVDVAPAAAAPVATQQLRRTRGLSTALLMAITTLMGADLISGLTLAGIAADPQLRTYMESDATTPPSTLTAAQLGVLDTLYLSASAYLLAVLAAAALVMVWTWQVRVNAEALSPLPHVRSRRWAWAGWITPFVSLWFPYQVLRDVDRADNAVLDAAETSRKAPVGAWWGFFVAYWTVGQAAAEVPGFGYEYVLVYLLSSLAGVIALVLFSRVVRTIEHDQQTVTQGLSVTPLFARPRP
jgi:hypothetical protein